MFLRLSQGGVLLRVGRGKLAENCHTLLLFKLLIMCVHIFPTTGGNSIEGHRLNLSCCSKANTAALIHSSNENVSIKVVGLEELFVRSFTLFRLVDITGN
jgi:hypothetical protein